MMSLCLRCHGAIFLLGHLLTIRHLASAVRVQFNQSSIDLEVLENETVAAKTTARVVVDERALGAALLENSTTATGKRDAQELWRGRILDHAQATLSKPLIGMFKPGIGLLATLGVLSGFPLLVFAGWYWNLEKTLKASARPLSNDALIVASCKLSPTKARTVKHANPTDHLSNNGMASSSSTLADEQPIAAKRRSSLPAALKYQYEVIMSEGSSEEEEEDGETSVCDNLVCKEAVPEATLPAHHIKDLPSCMSSIKSKENKRHSRCSKSTKRISWAPGDLHDLVMLYPGLAPKPSSLASETGHEF